MIPLLKLKYKNSAFKGPGSYVPQSPYNTYIGHVVPGPKWLSENEFAFSTGDYDSPVRVLDKRDIIEAWIDRNGGKDNVTVIEKKYIVTGGPFNRYSCTCTAYHYRKKCSHIDEARKI